MTKQRIAKFFILTASILATPALSMAGTEMKESKEVKTVVEKAQESWISGDLGVDVYSQYVFHGLVLENQGAIVQPYADVYIKLFESDGFLNTVTLNLGIWNSLHSNHTVQSSTRWFYEFDFLAGVSFVFAKNFTFTPTYVAYTSPGDYFQTSHNLNLKLAYNDADLLGAFALNPYGLVEFELDGKSGNGSDEGVYYEVGIAPGTTLGPISVSVPVKAGFGSNEYYVSNAGFGFVSAGVAVGYTIPIPEKFGTLTVSANATYIRFGDPGNNADAIKNSDDDTVFFGGGLKLAF